MSDTAIQVDGLGKLYRIGGKQKRHDRLSEQVMEIIASPIRRLCTVGQSPLPEETIWALRDVSFEIHRGEVVGIIGSNGAGKSTLLKILSRITEPTEGYARIHGRVGSLLEIGSGFHSELTGRENIYLNGTILGMRKAEVDRKFDEIVEFAEIEPFIDTPVKHYSSGMYVKLGFAVAAHLEVEILLVDEVLAVGDTAFQRKCLGKMEDVTSEGRTILFVSHNMAAIEGLCGRSILLDSGKLITDGPSVQVIKHYLEGTLPNLLSVPLFERTDRSGSGRVRFTYFHIEDRSGRRTVPLAGQDLVFVFGYECDPSQPPPKRVLVGFSMRAKSGERLFVLYNKYTGEEFYDIPAVGEFRCCVSRFPLVPGQYVVEARIVAGEEEADWPQGGIATIDVAAGDFFGTGSAGYQGQHRIYVDGSWTVR